jgi:hypothetical protein
MNILRILAIVAVFGLGCTSNTEPSGSKGPAMISVQNIPPPDAPMNVAPSRRAEFPIPVRRGGRIKLVLMNLAFSGTDGDALNNVGYPIQILEVDVLTAEYAERPFIIPEHHPTGIVGRFDDPNTLPPQRRAMLSARVYAALDRLLPLFATEPSTPWTKEAQEAARDVRDLFPYAAEPGLWPYYEAYGRDFFAWAEQHAPAGAARLPW